MKKNILIIKLGFVETLENKSEASNISLGDIIRTTVILHIFRKDNVTWLVTKEGLPLLVDNPHIARLLIYNPASLLQPKSEQFDIVINLEKTPRLCVLTDAISAKRKYGFKFDVRSGKAGAYQGAYEALSNSASPELRKKATKHWFAMLYDMLGVKWRGEGYILGYKPKTREKYDIGFNTEVSKKWSNKAWSMGNWKRLEELIGNRYSVSYQKSLNNLYGYMDWVNSCRLLVTNDSLGLHLALALNKKVVALFGPTSPKELKFFNRGISLTPEIKLDCIPCFEKECKYSRLCIDTISPTTVYQTIRHCLKTSLKVTSKKRGKAPTF